MADNFNSIARDIYSVRVEPPPNIDVRMVPGSPSPVLLALSIRDRASLKRALAMPPQGAILEIHMCQEDAMEIFSAIRKIAWTMGWPLPKEGESRLNA